MSFHRVSLASRTVGTLHIPGALRPGSEGGNQHYLAKTWGCQALPEGSAFAERVICIA